MLKSICNELYFAWLLRKQMSTVKYFILTLQIHKRPQKVQDVEELYVLILTLLLYEVPNSTTKRVIKKKFKIKIEKKREAIVEDIL